MKSKFTEEYLSLGKILVRPTDDQVADLRYGLALRDLAEDKGKDTNINLDAFYGDISQMILEFFERCDAEVLAEGV